MYPDFVDTLQIAFSNSSMRAGRGACCERSCAANCQKQETFFHIGWQKYWHLLSVFD